jgi:hypothetical protein
MEQPKIKLDIVNDKMIIIKGNTIQVHGNFSEMLNQLFSGNTKDKRSNK